jgi:hypothetical protein
MNDLQKLGAFRTHLERHGRVLEDMFGWANACDPRIAPVGWDPSACFRAKVQEGVHEPPSATMVVMGAAGAAFALAFLLARRRR